MVRSTLLALLALTATAFAAGASIPLGAQQPPPGDSAIAVTVRVESEGGPVGGAEVRADSLVRRTDPAGIALLRLRPGPREVVVAAPGRITARQRVVLAPGRDTTLRVALLPAPAEALDAIVVRSTRSDRRIEDQPLRVEVLEREEIEEKMLMTPGDISMMLNETGGLRVQVTSPGLGGANVRVQGLRGRYTQLLSDGLPLYGGQAGSLGLLQIPPMDLGQVEVIKGTASALYGASALGGVINLVARRPGDEAERELLVNASTLGGGDAVGYASGRWSERWGWTMLGGAHAQGRNDVDGDRWADVPGFRRLVVRPRLFWDGEQGRSVFATLGVTAEDRDGGGQVASGEHFVEALATGRVDGGVVGRWLLGGNRLLGVRASGMRQRHRHRFGEVTERDAHATGFVESTLGGTTGAHAWLVGAALQHDRYAARDVAGFDYRYWVPGLFAQDEWEVAPWLTLSASGRLDRHNEFGTSFNPRVSALARAGEWTARASAGSGFHAPTPFTEETEAIGLARLGPPRGLVAERARSASLDVGRAFGELELNGSVFGSVVERALQLQATPDGTLRLANARAPTRTHGTELLARFHTEAGLHLTASHTYLRSTEPDPDGGARREVPLTPRHAAGVVGMWEREGRGRVGLELYYTGRQRLERNPFRSQSEPYLVIGMLAERRFGRARAFVNLENLGDVRQSRHDPLVLPARSREGRWTVDAWAPLEGRAVNAGVRLEF